MADSMTEDPIDVVHEYAERLICEGGELDLEGKDNINALIKKLFRDVEGYSPRATISAFAWVMQRIAECETTSDEPIEWVDHIGARQK
jgi:hypothetical protein